MQKGEGRRRREGEGEARTLLAAESRVKAPVAKESYLDPPKEIYPEPPKELSRSSQPPNSLTRGQATECICGGAGEKARGSSPDQAECAPAWDLGEVHQKGMVRRLFKWSRI